MDIQNKKEGSSQQQVRNSRKRKLSSTGFDDDVAQRPIKRYNSSSQSETSPDSSACSLSPQYPESITSSDDEKFTKQAINDKTYTISTSDAKKKFGECSKSIAGNQRDSQTVVYSSSSKNNQFVSNKSLKNATTIEIVSSPESAGTSEVSDFDAVTNLDVDDLGSDYSVFSPLETESLKNDRKLLVNKNEKTPHSQKNKQPVPTLYYKTKVDDKVPCYVTPSSEQRVCPLPILPWADRESVWKSMVRKDEKASLSRDVNMFESHPGLQPRMRAILLDWLIEVCEVYKLHRETYYLTVDYLDRYLTAKQNISKNQLQLIGITCLFVASKVEEIYPPKLHEFAYVTDGACSEEDILQQEILILQALNWCITPVTIMGWVSIYMQLNATQSKTDVAGIEPKALLLLNSSKYGNSFIYPQFTSTDFARTAQLIDLCSLDVGIANFPYSIIAAAAISHVLDKNTSKKVSGLDWATIAPCAKWMEPYYQVLEEEAEYNPILLLEQNEQVEISYGLSHVCPNLNKDPSHIIQTHSTSLDVFDKGILRREQLEAAETIIKQEASPAPSTVPPCPPGILTPPASNRKSAEISMAN
ncbi:G1/S-specific cyclin-E [Chironomus tepperi]|uniref:G1/S-specific cyclin-E n=1 Tax=Chironomus tepperi TaxID=113505 RepID=UPI00391FAFFE